MVQTKKGMDSEVIEIFKKEKTLVSKIEQADDYKEGVFQVVIRLD